PSGGDALVVGAPEGLGAAERVLDRLAEDPGEGEAEELVADEIEEAHGLALHGVDQPHAVDELARAGAERLVEAREVFGGDGEVGVEDHEDVAACGREAGAHGVSLALAPLLEEGPGETVEGGEGALERGPGVVGGVSLDEDELGARAHGGDAI